MNNLQDKTIGVIGYGKFGKIVCQYLFPKNKIVLFTSQKIATDERISIADSLKHLLEKSDIVVPAVPIHEWENVLKEIVPWKKEQTIILDILSVKEYSVTILQRYFSSNQYIATHPMFGPTSIRKNNNTIQGFTIVFCPIDKSVTYTSFMKYCRELGLTVQEMTTEQHDTTAAYSQFFSLAVREMGKQLKIKPTPIDTPGAQAMLELLTYGFDKGIIKDMVTYNIHCAEVLQKMQTVIKSLQDN